MKKIMFNDKYGLTQAVLKGIKTQTRRVAKGFCPEGTDECLQRYMEFSRYKVGDIVAIAQSYYTIAGNRMDDNKSMLKYMEIIEEFKDEFVPEKIWGNKMFSRASFMPHHIKITGVRLERLNDISDTDCLAEGIEMFYNLETEERTKVYDVCRYAEHPLGKKSFSTPKEAYAELIDKLGKKGDWNKNPLVFVYDFTLID